ncbi:MAG: hypothetical protein GY944_29190 [bacterium]|nr:hypothetical protein [bacterium]
MKGYDVVVASTAGGNYMLDFFRDQTDLWSEQPHHDHLQSLRLIGNGTTDEGPSDLRVDIIEQLLLRLDGSLDYLVVRQTQCDASGGIVRIAGRRAGERADGWIERRGNRIAYRFERSDLLGTDRLTPYRPLSDRERSRHRDLRERCLEASKQPLAEAWCDEAAWRELASYTARPDSVVQIAHLYDLDRAGTVNLFPREGIGYNTLVPGRHAGESFYEKDAFVGIWGKPVTASSASSRIRTLINGQAPIAIFEYLRGQSIREEDEGFGYPSVGPTLFPESLDPR